MAYCFYDNPLGSYTLQSDLLANLTSCTNVASCFDGASGMSGDGLTFISNCPASITGGNAINCFAGCTNLSDYASIPAAWGGGGA